MTTVAEIMSTDVRTVTPEKTLRHAAQQAAAGLLQSFTRATGSRCEPASYAHTRIIRACRRTTGNRTRAAQDPRRIGKARRRTGSGRHGHPS